MPLKQTLCKDGSTHTSQIMHFNNGTLAKNLLRHNTWIIEFEVDNENFTESHVNKLSDALKNNKMTKRIAFIKCSFATKSNSKIKNLVAIKNETIAKLGFKTKSPIASAPDMFTILQSLFENRNLTLQQINFDKEIYLLGLEINKVLAAQHATSVKDINQAVINDLAIVFANHSLHLATKADLFENDCFRYLKLAASYFSLATTFSASQRNNQIKCLKLLIDKYKIMVDSHGKYEYLIKLYDAIKTIPNHELSAENREDLKNCIEQLIQTNSQMDKKIQIQIELYQLYSVKHENERNDSDWRRLLCLTNDIIASRKSDEQITLALSALKCFGNIKEKTLLDWQALEACSPPLRSFNYLFKAKSSLPSLLDLCFKKAVDSEIDEYKMTSDMLNAEIYQPKHHKIRHHYQQLIAYALALYTEKKLPDCLLKASLINNPGLLDECKTALESLKKIDDDALQKENEMLKKLNAAYENQIKALEGMLAELAQVNSNVKTSSQAQAQAQAPVAVAVGSVKKWRGKQKKPNNASFFAAKKQPPNNGKNPKNGFQPKPQ